MELLNKIQNTVKCLGAIYFTIGLITACSKYDASELNMIKNEDSERTYSDSESEPIQPCNDCGSLCIAAKNGHETCVKAFLKTGTNVDTYYTRTWYTSLMIASMYGHGPCVKALADAGADVDASDQEDNTALILAARNGHALCINILIEAGADVEAHDQEENTALIWAARNGYAQCVKELIEAWADVNASDKNGNTALMWARRNRSESCIILLTR